MLLFNVKYLLGSLDLLLGIFRIMKMQDNLLTEKLAIRV